jgi:hypothetical protein
MMSVSLMRMMRSISVFAAMAAALLACEGAFAQGNAPPSSPPITQSSATQSSAATGTSGAQFSATKADSLPQDKHDGLTVSADPYTQPGRSKSKFDKADPLPVGILSVEVFLHNETTHPFHINMETIQLVVHPRGGAEQNVDWMPAQDVAAAVAHPKGPSAPQQRRLPLGIGSSSDNKTDKLAGILKPLALGADVVPPMGTIHGFLFFNVDHDLSLAEGASLYVPDVTAIPGNKPLMFFEVEFGK